MKKVLFVTYGGGHVNIVIPIAKEIEKYNDIEFSIVAFTTAIPVLEVSGLKFKTLIDYLPFFKDSKKIIDIGDSLAPKYHNPEAGFSIEETSAYLGCSMYDLIQKIGEKDALTKFYTEGRKAFCPTSIMQQILKIEQPDILVTTVPYRMEKAAVIEAKNLGIKTVFIHDLHFVKQNNLYDIIDIHCVMNKFVKEQLISYGIGENKIFITGQPAFDYLLNPINRSKNDIYKEFGLLLHKKTIIWIADNSKVLTKTYFNEIAKVINEFKEYQFIIKMHPGEENIDIFEKICEESNNNNTILIHRCNNKELIYIGDLFLVGLSTMGLEISRMNKNIINLDYDNLWENREGNELKYFRYDICGLALLVNEIDKLKYQINRCFYDKEVQNSLKNNREKFYFNITKASVKIINLLSKV